MLSASEYTADLVGYLDFAVPYPLEDIPVHTQYEDFLDSKMGGLYR
ncbi:MAG: hypothetical protein QMC38_16950 [Sinobacterium sp.]